MSSGRVYCECRKPILQTCKDPHIKDKLLQLTKLRYEALTSTIFVIKRTTDVDADVEVPNLSKDIVKRIKHSKKHAKAGTVRSIIDGWRTRCFATVRRRLVGRKISVMNGTKWELPLDGSANVTINVRIRSSQL